jgi:hypothetical protein
MKHKNEMEQAPLEALELTLSELMSLSRQDLFFRKVAGKQIMKALCQECGIRFARDFFYKVLQGAANEARRRGLLINPNHYTREQHATHTNACPSLMLPSKYGWEMTKGILTRHLADAVNYISELIRAQELIALQVAEFKHNDTVQTTNDTCNTPPPLHKRPDVHV